MKILGLDSSGLVASVAVLEDDNLCAEYTVNFKKTHSQTLLPMLDVIAEMIQLDLNTVDGIAVAAGPGSFTGLRIGSATAKGLGLALQKPLLAVPTLDALAYNIFDAKELVCPIMDARRNQVYTGVYTYEEHQLQVLRESDALDIHQLIEELNQMRREVIFLGDGVAVYRSVIDAELTVPHTYAPAHCNKQRASAVAALGLQYMENGKVVSAAEFQPDYLRKSQAEREREEKEKA